MNTRTLAHSTLTHGLSHRHQCRILLCYIRWCGPAEWMGRPIGVMPKEIAPPPLACPKSGTHTYTYIHIFCYSLLWSCRTGCDLGSPILSVTMKEILSIPASTQCSSKVRSTYTTFFSPPPRLAEPPLAPSCIRAFPRAGAPCCTCPDASEAVRSTHRIPIHKERMKIFSVPYSHAFWCLELQHNVRVP
jgi:hypothetical protein